MTNVPDVLLFGLTERSLKRTILISGASLALLALAACVQLGNIMLVMLMDGWGQFGFLGIFLLAVAALGARKLFDSLRSRAGLPPAGFGRLTAIRVLFQLSQLVAVPLLGGGWLLAWALGLNFQAAAFQALLLVLVGGIWFTMAIGLIAHIAEITGTAMGLKPLVSLQPPAAP